MKNIGYFILLSIVLCSACSPVNAITPEASYTPLVRTLTPNAFPTFTITSTESRIAPTETIFPTADPTITPTPIIEITQLPTGESPGVNVIGTAARPNGEGIAGVNIYYALSSYPVGTLLDTTDASGNFAGFISIPHDETVRIWAEFENYIFKPGNANRSWINGQFAWHHYSSYERATLGFIGTP